jgi:hypothetical protein
MSTVEKGGLDKWGHLLPLEERDDRLHEIHALNPFPRPWTSKYAHKHPTYQHLLICNPDVLPVITMNLAALCIQKAYRGHYTRQMLSDQHLKRKTALAHRQAEQANRARVRGIEAGHKLQSEFFATQGVEPMEDPELYASFCAYKIQQAWHRRGEAARRKLGQHVLYACAQRSICRQWKRYNEYQEHNVHAPRLRNKRATVIQRWWRGYTNKKVCVCVCVSNGSVSLCVYVSQLCVLILVCVCVCVQQIYQYYRTLIIEKQNSNPSMLMKNLSRKEAGLMDNASGLYVRFRLGGTDFPPVIYFKIYTSTTIQDIGSFAPRDYSRERGSQVEETQFKSQREYDLHAAQSKDDNKEHWYKRHENNGWRQIAVPTYYEVSRTFVHV